MKLSSNIHTAADFWALVADVWHYGFMGIAIGQIVLALVVFAVAGLARHLFSTAILRHIHVRFGRAEVALDPATIEALGPPIHFIPIAIVSQIVTADPDLPAIFAEVNRSLVAFTIFWALFAIIAPVLSTVDRRVAIFSHVMIGCPVRVGRTIQFPQNRLPLRHLTHATTWPSMKRRARGSDPACLSSGPPAPPPARPAP